MTAAGERGIAKDRSFAIRRTFSAPAPEVFELWTDPALVRQWWGIKNCTIPTCTLDVRVGGEWRIDMRTASGKLYKNHGVYRSVIADSYLEYTDIPDPTLAEWGGLAPGESVHAVTFDGDGNFTHVTFEVTLATAMDRERLLALGVREGWMQSFDRLVAVIEATTGV